MPGKLGTYIRPDVNGLSSLATAAVPHRRDAIDRSEPVFGVVLHQTGSGTVENAQKHGWDPLQAAVAEYLNPANYYAHYVVGYDGTIAQIADEHERAPHVGVSTEERQNFLSGSWKTMVASGFVALWQKRWPTFKSPSHLYPGPSVNNVYVGIEMIPIVNKSATPRMPGLIYTQAQHQAVARLCVDIAKRWGFPALWEKSNRLVCHEDVNPLTRTTKVPPAGWDPGVIRETPWFDWAYLLQQIGGTLSLARYRVS